MKLPDEIVVVDRFAPLRTQLLTLLAGLGDDDWARPTGVPHWSVNRKTAVDPQHGRQVRDLSGVSTAA